MAGNARWVSILASVMVLTMPAARADVSAAGAFTHGVDIRLPVGAGVQPDISLAYDSQAGDGPLGVGWSLGGFPAITRMNYGAGINYNAGDTFVGPDGRLVNFHGTHSYRSEEESWAKYVPHNADGSVWSGHGGCGNGPCYWVVTLPDGETHQYGATADSRIEAMGRGAAVREWALSRVTDTRGNYYTVEYREDSSANGDYYPIRVTYNQGNGRTLFYVVDFAYEVRNDVTPEFSQSARVRANQRLKSITVSGNGQRLHKYRLRYEYGSTTGVSRLISVQELGRTDDATRPAQRFSYQEGTAAWAEHQEFPHWGPSQQLTDNNKYPVLMGDWNGDGKSDIGRVRAAGVLFQTSTGNGWQLYPDALGFGQDNGFTDGSKYPIFSGDWNGDGRTDIGRVGDGGVVFNVSTGSGWAAYTGLAGWSPLEGFTDAGTHPLLTGDWNGDGKTDVGRINNEGIQFRVSTGSGWQDYPDGPAWAPVNKYFNATLFPVLTGDWNGDGRTDIGRVYENGVTFAISTGSGWEIIGSVVGWGPKTGYVDGNQFPIFTGDWNGDGKTDVGRVGRASVSFKVSTGTDWQGYAEGPGWGPNDKYSDANKFPMLTGDWNGDGMTDIGRVFLNGVTFMVSTGEGWSEFATHADWGPDKGYVDSNIYPFYMGDWTGEGKSGLGRVHHNGIEFITRAGATPDVMTSAVNEWGGTTSVTYLPATQVQGAIRPDLTTCGGTSGSACGNANPSPTPLVTRLAIADGRGNTYSTRYSYHNARYFPGVPSEARNLGFQSLRAFDEQRGTSENSDYRQDRPFQGRVAQTTLSSGDPLGIVLNVQRFDYAIVPSTRATRLIRLVSQEEEHYEGSRARLTHRTRTNFEHDAYGNVRLESRLNDDATPGDDVYVAFNHINDESLWRIGVPALTRSCSDSACSYVLQQTSQQYDGLPHGQVGQRGDVSSTSAWRSDTSSYLHTLFTYDASGSLLTTTNAAGVVEFRNQYEAASGRLLRVTDALGHSVSNTYETASGLLTSVTDVNGNLSSFAYDAFGRRVRSETPHDGSSRTLTEESLAFAPNLETVTVHTETGTLVTTRHMDGMGRVFKTLSTWDGGSFLQTDAFFDSAGRQHRTCAPHLSTHPVDESTCTTRYYDARDRIVRIDTPRSGGGQVSVTSVHDGYRTTTTDAAGHITVSDYDPATRTSTLTQPGELATSTRKDALGRVVSVIDPARNEATYTYNSLGWKLSESDPVTGTATYTYDALGRVSTRTDAAGQTVAMYYDTAGRLVRTDHAPLNATAAGAEDTVLKYDYLSSPGDVANGTGRVVRVQDRSGVTVIAYDAAGRTRTGTKSVDGAQFVSTTTFDRLGNRTSVTYPDGSVVRYRYETDARHLSAISLDGIDLIRYGDYDTRGRPTTLVYGDDINRVSLTFEASTGELLQQQDSRDFVNTYYAYDARAMLVGERDLRAARPNGDTSKAFAYDPLGQLIAASMGSNAACTAYTCSGDAWSSAYGYDGTGRVIEKDGKAFNYDTAKHFQLKRVAGESADRTYDPVGRLLTRQAATGAERYVNGSDGFLHEHYRGAALVHRMTYDYQGNRTKKEYLGANAQTTWDLGNYKVVHDQASGKYFHTLYVTGLSGSRIAHRTVEKPGLGAAVAWTGYQDRALASLYDPTSVGGMLPWAKHHGFAAFAALVNDLDGARGVTAAFAGLAILLALFVGAAISLWQLATTVFASLRERAQEQRRRRRALWFAPAMVVIATTACVGSYEEEAAAPATADAIAKDGRYGLIQAISPGGTNVPVPGTFYYLNSPIGSTSVMFDAAGTALLRLEYFPDGSVNQAASLGDYIATHTFGQKEYDKELEAYYNRFRYYDAATSRFTTPDAVKDSDDFLVHNTYAYTRNNPINYIDPTGFWALKADGQTGYRPVRPPAPAAPPQVYRPSSRDANPRRTSGFNNGPDGGRRVAATWTKPPPPPRQQTDRFNRGPDGMPLRPKRFIPDPRGHMAPDGVRGYEASGYSRYDSIQFERIMTNGMPSMRTPGVVHDVLDVASMIPGPVGGAAGAIDAGLYLLVDGDLAAAALSVIPAGRAVGGGDTATVYRNGPGHFSIEVNGLGTHQLVSPNREWTTIVTTANAPPPAAIASRTISLPNAAAAARLQRELLGKSNLGPYNVVTNSCVSHVCSVLQAGGVKVPPPNGSDQSRYLLRLVQGER